MTGREAHHAPLDRVEVGCRRLLVVALLLLLSLQSFGMRIIEAFILASALCAATTLPSSALICAALSRAMKVTISRRSFCDCSVRITGQPMHR